MTHVNYDEDELTPRAAAMHIMKCIEDRDHRKLTCGVFRQCPQSTQLAPAGTFGTGSMLIFGGYKFYAAETKIAGRALMAPLAAALLPVEAVAAAPITTVGALAVGAGALLTNVGGNVTHRAVYTIEGVRNAMGATEGFESRHGFPRSELKTNASALSFWWLKRGDTVLEMVLKHNGDVAKESYKAQTIRLLQAILSTWDASVEEKRVALDRAIERTAKALKEPRDSQRFKGALHVLSQLDVEDSTAGVMPADPRSKRWGDGLDSPAAGARNFTPHGFVANPDVAASILPFGHDETHIATIMQRGRQQASTSPTPLAEKHAAVLYAYTEDSPLYSELNFTMRTPHSAAHPTDTKLCRYAHFITHARNALNSLPPHVSEVHGQVYRGIRALLKPEVYAEGNVITWQGFSSCTKEQLATLDFVKRLPGRRLQGSLFIISSIGGARDICHFSAIPAEEEVLFPPNSQFLVLARIISEQAKRDKLQQLCAYDMGDLDVYELEQTA